LPFGIPGIGLVMEGAMQQAPQRSRHVVMVCLKGLAGAPEFACFAACLQGARCDRAPAAIPCNLRQFQHLHLNADAALR